MNCSCKRAHASPRSKLVVFNSACLLWAALLIGILLESKVENMWQITIFNHMNTSRFPNVHFQIRLKFEFQKLLITILWCLQYEKIQCQKCYWWKLSGRILSQSPHCSWCHSVNMNNFEKYFFISNPILREHISNSMLWTWFSKVFCLFTGKLYPNCRSASLWLHSRSCNILK